MLDAESRRKTVRITLDDRYTLRFEVEGRVFRSVELTNISMGGLGLKVDHREAVRMQVGTLLKGMVFEHPLMPKVKVDGEVRHLMGQNLHNADGKVIVGVQFHNPSPGVMILIQEYIEGRLELES